MNLEQFKETAKRMKETAVKDLEVGLEKDRCYRDLQIAYTLKSVCELLEDPSYLVNDEWKDIFVSILNFNKFIDSKNFKQSAFKYNKKQVENCFKVRTY